LIGAAGYIAPRHFEAIKALGGDLVAVMDHHDAMGKLDEYFPKAKLFTEESTFFEYLSVENNGNQPMDYLVVCTPNHLHEKHILAGLSIGSAVICEKPLCLTQEELNTIEIKSLATGLPVYTIMQLRLHEEVLRLKDFVGAHSPAHRFDVKLSYFTPRGNWYDSSWKSDAEKSGGILMNIGIHLFDLMAWIFGAPVQTKMISSEQRYAEGILQTDMANIHWKLGIDMPGAVGSVQTTQPIRLIEVDGELFDLSVYSADLHTQSYSAILKGNGFDVIQTALGMSTLFDIRNLTHQTT